MTLSLRDQAAAVATGATALLAELPPFCGPLGDLNRDAVCARSARLFSLTGWLTAIVEDEARISRLRSPRRVENLTRFVAEVRGSQLADYRRWIAEGWLGECTHPPTARRDLTLADALPACCC